MQAGEGKCGRSFGCSLSERSGRAGAVQAWAVFQGGILLVALLSESLAERDFWRALRSRSPAAEATSQRLVAVPYEEPSWRRELHERRQVEESRPLCEEERKSLEVRELIYSSSWNFIQSRSQLNLREFHLIPRKVDVIRCVSGHSNEESEAVCKPENCRERKVDVEVFGRLVNETRNMWGFLGTLSAVPVACECFVRWKPHKCSRSADIFLDF